MLSKEDKDIKDNVLVELIKTNPKMKLEDIVPNIRKGSSYSHEIDTGLGVMQITLDVGKHLACNFVGNEKRAKLVFGHWKVNTFVKNPTDILNHIGFINSKIENYQNG